MPYNVLQSCTRLAVGTAGEPPRFPEGPCSHKFLSGGGKHIDGIYHFLWTLQAAYVKLGLELGWEAHVDAAGAQATVHILGIRARLLQRQRSLCTISSIPFLIFDLCRTPENYAHGRAAHSRQRPVAGRDADMRPFFLGGKQFIR